MRITADDPAVEDKATVEESGGRSGRAHHLRYLEAALPRAAGSAA